MATQYGDDTEPGIITEETSADSVRTDGDAPSDVCIVGPADLANASNAATVNTIYEITRETTAVDRFGPKDGSLLTTAVVDQLGEGASPIYAVATEATDVSDEAHDAPGSTTVSVDNAPCSEDPDDWTVTLDGTDQSTKTMVLDDVSSYSPADGEVYINAVEGEVEINTTPSNTLDIDYTHYDYTSALDEVESNLDAAEEIDFISAIQELDTVQQDVLTTADNMADGQNYAMALVAPNAATIDPDTYTATYDSSRAQVIYPTRFEDKTSALAAYGGLRGRLGLDRTPIRQHFNTDKRLITTLTRPERGTLIDEQVVPLENRSTGAVVRDDKTAVQPDNTDEANIDFGFKRLALDYVYEVAEENEEPFIGRLHQEGTRNALADLIGGQLSAMKKSDIVEEFTVNVYEESATRARLELRVDAPDPLRFIVNDVRIGDIN